MWVREEGCAIFDGLLLGGFVSSGGVDDLRRATNGLEKQKPTKISR